MAISEYVVQNYINSFFVLFGHRFLRQSLEVMLNPSHECNMRFKTRSTSLRKENFSSTGTSSKIIVSFFLSEKRNLKGKDVTAIKMFV